MAEENLYKPHGARIRILINALPSKYDWMPIEDVEVAKFVVATTNGGFNHWAYTESKHTPPVNWASEGSYGDLLTVYVGSKDTRIWAFKTQDARDQFHADTGATKVEE